MGNRRWSSAAHARPGVHQTPSATIQPSAPLRRWGIHAGVPQRMQDQEYTKHHQLQYSHQGLCACSGDCELTREFPSERVAWSTPHTSYDAAISACAKRWRWELALELLNACTMPLLCFVVADKLVSLMFFIPVSAKKKPNIFVNAAVRPHLPPKFKVEAATNMSATTCRKKATFCKAACCCPYQL